jgi:hypothetical protein
MGFRCGIVGLPNVGKSSLFNALTKAGIAAENYPFCTIEPNVGIVPVPDERLQAIAALVQPKNVVPATMQFVDIAGLVEGASKGEGLGNQFLAHIRETQAIAHVVRCFDDPNVTHVSGRVDPVSDIETIQTELALADLDTVSNALMRESRRAKSGDRDARLQVEVLTRLLDWLNAGHPAASLAASHAEDQVIARFSLLTSKPVLYVANVAEAELAGNAYSRAVGMRAAAEGAKCIVLCAALEADLAGLAADEQRQFLSELGLEEPGLNRLIRAGYELLGLGTYFTAGPKECRAWTFRRGMRAPEAAGIIHGDFEKGFIRAEVVGYDDFIRNRGETGAKEAGAWRLEGKDYVVRDGDVMHFRFNV